MKASTRIYPNALIETTGEYEIRDCGTYVAIFRNGEFLEASSTIPGAVRRVNELNATSR